MNSDIAFLSFSTNLVTVSYPALISPSCLLGRTPTPLFAGLSYPCLDTLSDVLRPTSASSMNAGLGLKVGSGSR